MIYLDMDGVLTNFDKAVEKALGTDNSYKWEFVHGTDAFWKTINKDLTFWDAMEPMPDAHILLDALKTSKNGETFRVLTALPKKDDKGVAASKRNWIKKHVGDVWVITCLTSEKSNFCQEGDVLIDDRAVNEKKWRDKGGQFILHRDAMSTVSILTDMWII